MITTRVAILGGGLAGLLAARGLQRRGIPFHLFEARDRLGGRILTVDDAGRPDADGFDLGPSWFWPHAQPELARLVAELGLSAMAQHAAGDMMFERRLHEPAQRSGGGGQDQGSMRLVGGTGALVRGLAESLPAECIHLNAPVTALHLAEGRITLTFAGGRSLSETVTAAHVMSALPPRLMADSIGLTPAMDAATVAMWRATPTWMAPHAKVFAVYDRPFWRDAGLSGMAQSLVGPLVEIHDATTASGRAALFGFVGVPARARATLSADDLIRAAVDQLVRLFGPEAATPRATLLKDWATDPFTATRADSGETGHPTPRDAPWVTGAWEGRLSLAGSETSRTEPGYLAGAVEAARRAVDAFAKGA